MCKKIINLIKDKFINLVHGLNVAITFNQKPDTKNDSNPIDADTFPALVPESGIDTYAEWDSPETIQAVYESLSLYHQVTLIEANEAAYQTLLQLKPDIVFNIAEGLHGISREAQIPAMLEFLQIPYTGSDPMTLSICLDKARTKEILAYHQIPTARFAIIDSPQIPEGFDLKFPVFLKPNGEGSSKGIFSSSLVMDTASMMKEAEKMLSVYGGTVIAEEFLTGDEFTVAVMGNGADAVVLPMIRMDYSKLPEGVLPIFSYETKWIYDTKETPLDIYECPAKISSALEEQIKNTVLRTYSVLRCRDWSRIDVRLSSDGVPNIIEVNPLPGILPDPEEHSCYPASARAAGIGYKEMLNRVLTHAAKRYGLYED